MFEGALSFNQPLQDWNVHNVQNMSRMFYGACKFQQPLTGWKGRLHATVDKNEIFFEAFSYLDKYGLDL
jgi:hypothetical protein